MFVFAYEGDFSELVSGKQSRQALETVNYSDGNPVGAVPCDRPKSILYAKLYCLVEN
jgi:hypothetical protein